MISFQGVSFAYKKEEPVLASLNLELGPGLTLFLGPNGCGKSTLLKLASGVESPDSGRMLIDGRDLWIEEVASRRELTYVPEQPDLSPYATIGEVLRLVCRVRGEPLDKGRAALAFFNLSAEANRTVRELSLGQRKRALWATAFIGSPKHILLDEPLDTLDRAIADEVLVWIQKKTAERAVLGVVSHQLEPFLELAARAVSIRNKQTVLYGPLPSNLTERRSLLEDLARGK